MTWPDTTLANAACTRSITEIVPGAALHLSSELQPFVSHTTGLHCSLGLHTRNCRVDPIHIPVQDTTVQCALHPPASPFSTSFNIQLRFLFANVYRMCAVSGSSLLEEKTSSVHRILCVSRTSPVSLSPSNKLTHHPPDLHSQPVCS